MGPYIRPTATVDVTASAARACPLFPNMVKTDGLFPKSDAAPPMGHAGLKRAKVWGVSTATVFGARLKLMFQVV